MNKMYRRIVLPLVLCSFLTVETFGASVFENFFRSFSTFNSDFNGFKLQLSTWTDTLKTPTVTWDDPVKIPTVIWSDPIKAPTATLGYATTAPKGGSSGSGYCGYKLKTKPGIQEFSVLNHLYGHKDLTYTIDKYTRKISKSNVDYIIAQAFKVWAEVADFTFTGVNSHPADIVLSFVVRDHGDRDPFDGKEGILAHAGYGFVHFDDEENWSTGFDSGATNLYAVAIHEIGHVLGLDHSEIQKAVMYKSYDSNNVKTKLHSDDINGIQQLYGANIPSGNDNTVGGGDSTDDCWTTGCQPNSWAVVGCDQYDRTERSRIRCSGGFMYECCAGKTKHNPNRPPTASADCWSTGCQLNSWAVIGCQQYGMYQVGRYECTGGHIFKCCKKS